MSAVVSVAETPVAQSRRVNVSIVGPTRQAVLDAAIHWRNTHWAYGATISEPVAHGDGWRATGNRWSTL